MLAEETLLSEDPDLPIYKFHLSKADELMIKWKLYLPQVIPYYAVKALAHEKVLRKLATLGCHFDCASKGEIAKVRSLCNQDIIYANSFRSADHLRYAAEIAKVELYTFDCLDEAIRVVRFCPNAKLIMRISVNNPHAGCNFGEKFGVLEDDIPEIMQGLELHGLEVYGLSFHAGSGNTDLSIFSQAIQLCHDIIQKYFPSNFYPQLLDIGGGFVNNADFPIVCRSIQDSLKLYFAKYPKLTIIAEPGRYFSEDLMTLECTIISKRIRKGRYCYTINDSIYGIFCCARDRYKIYTEEDIRLINPITNLSHGNEESEGLCTGKEKKLSIIYGQTCDSGDIITKDVYLPEYNVGDRLEFLRMGAYGIDVCSEFNGFQNGKIVFMEEEVTKETVPLSTDLVSKH